MFETPLYKEYVPNTKTINPIIFSMILFIRVFILSSG
jgi:hypothetical protein